MATITGLGMMSGTSADGIDAVVVKFRGGGKPSVGERVSLHYPDALSRELRALATADTFSVDRIGALAVELGVMHAKLAGDAIKKTKAKPDFIALHGQTIRHRPENGFTWQLIDPTPVTEATGLTVVSDFRCADVAAGGEGAPLVPYAHRFLFEKPRQWTAVVNIGGIANVTFLPPKNSKDVITGFDTGPGNLLIDAWVQKHTGKAYDDGGKIARKGTPQPEGREWLKAERYFEEPPPKSTGRELFAGAFLKRIEPELKKMAFEDAVATLTMFTAGTIADQLLRWVPAEPGNIIVCGGGALNSTLVWALQQILPEIPVTTSDRHGVDPQAVEGACFAVMGYETLRGRPSNVPSVTGASRPLVLGRISPGENYLKITRALAAGGTNRLKSRP